MKAALAFIKSDPVLLDWARASIRYNDGRQNQAVDFEQKLRSNKVALTATVGTLRAVLAQIEKDDKQ